MGISNRQLPGWMLRVGGDQALRKNSMIGGDQDVAGWIEWIDAVER
jgi:hypothetical protein